MKALTLWQPWASLVALGEKKIETRSWSTTYRGVLAIHAAKAFTGEHMELCSKQPFLTALKPALAQYRIPFHFPRGSIVAVCELSDCLAILSEERYLVPPEYTDHRHRVLLPPHDPEFSFGDYTPGRFAWILSNIRALERPIPCRGYQQLWSVPAHIASSIAAQIKEQAT